MRGWVGEGLGLIIAMIAFSAVIAVFLSLFLVPSGTGLPEAFNYFAGIFTR